MIPEPPVSAIEAAAATLTRAPARFSPPAFETAWRLTWPFATNDLTAGCRRLPRNIAVSNRYVQVNPCALVLAVIVDVDHDRAITSWHEVGLVEPNWIAQNPANDHAHLAWVLAAPVARTECARPKPLRLLARIEAGLVAATGADASYAGLLTKNPLNPAWITHWGPAKAYGLEDLKKSLGIFCPKQLPRKPENASLLGRNCALFDTVRLWSYSAVRRYRNGPFEQWQQAVEDQCTVTNERFNTPLPSNEVRDTAKSIAKWVWENFNEETFRTIQSNRARKLGKQRRGNRPERLRDAIEN